MMGKRSYSKRHPGTDAQRAHRETQRLRPIVDLKKTRWIPYAYMEPADARFMYRMLSALATMAIVVGLSILIIWLVIG